MRIISGYAKGRKLLSPNGMQTRPTLDRVKESIFDIIQNKIYNSTVIDVFSGTGSLGLEAVSRGAKLCYLVDKSPDTFKFLQQNVINLNFSEKCKCINMDSYDVLKRLGNDNIVFDLIFIDPPYRKNMIPPAVEIVSQYNMLSKDGIIVSKIDSIEEIYNGNEIIKLYDYRKYGKTTICLYKYKEEHND